MQPTLALRRRQYQSNCGVTAAKGRCVGTAGCRLKKTAPATDLTYNKATIPSTVFAANSTNHRSAPHRVARLRQVGSLLLFSLFARRLGYRALLLSVVFMGAGAAAQTNQIAITTGEWPPYNGKKLPGEGFANAIVRAAFCEMGIEVRFEYFPWSRALKLAGDGSWDASAIWAFSEKRSRVLYYSVPIVEGQDVFYYRVGTDFDWQSLEDLHRWKLGGTIGYSYPALNDATGKILVPMERAPSDVLNFRKLLAGRIDVFVADRRVGEYLLTNAFTAAERAKIRQHPQILSTIQYYLVFSKRGPHATFLLATFNEGIARLRARNDFPGFLVLSGVSENLDP